MEQADPGSIRSKAYELLLSVASGSWVLRSDALAQLLELEQDTEDREIRLAALVAARALTSDPEEVVRADAFDAIATLGNRADQRRINEAIRDEHWSVRALAASASARVMGSRASLRLVELLHDRNEVVRKYAGVALFKAAGCKYLREVLKLLDKERRKVARAGLCHYAAMCGDRHALDELEELAKDADPGVAISARESIDEAQNASR